MCSAGGSAKSKTINRWPAHRRLAAGLPHDLASGVAHLMSAESYTAARRYRFTLDLTSRSAMLCRRHGVDRTRAAQASWRIVVLSHLAVAARSLRASPYRRTAASSRRIDAAAGVLGVARESDRATLHVDCTFPPSAPAKIVLPRVCLALVVLLVRPHSILASPVAGRNPSPQFNCGFSADRTFPQRMMGSGMSTCGHRARAAARDPVLRSRAPPLLPIY